MTAHTAERHDGIRDRERERVARWVRMMRRRGAPATDEAIVLAARLFQLPCAYCGRITRRPCIDHIVPIAKGGRTVSDNLAPACVSCNSRKGNHSVLWFLLEWAQRLQDQRTGYRQHVRIDYELERSA